MKSKCLLSDSYKDLLGAKYTLRGRTKEEGFDCYGLVIEVLRRNGIVFADRLLENNIESINAKEITKPEKLCIIEFEKGTQYHIAVYLGDGKIIHAIPHFGVCIEPLYRYEVWVRRYLKCI